jgi:hypothetical protein
MQILGAMIFGYMLTVEIEDEEKSDDDSTEGG